MTKRTIIIDIDTPIGNRLYWFIKSLELSCITEKEETEE